MATKKELIQAAHDLGISEVDATWSKKDIEDAIASYQDDADEEKSVSVDVGIMNVTVTAGEDGEFGTEDDRVEIKPVIEHMDKPVEFEPLPEFAGSNEYQESKPLPEFVEVAVSAPHPLPSLEEVAKVPVPVWSNVDKVENIRPVKTFDPNLHKCLCTMTYEGKVYEAGQEIRMPAKEAEVHIKNGALGPVDVNQAQAIRKYTLKRGEYILECDLTLDGVVHRLGNKVELTAEQADLYERIGAIKAPV
jgi:hypothetical protein